MQLTANKVYAVRVFKLVFENMTNQEFGKIHPEYDPMYMHPVYTLNNDFFEYTDKWYNDNGCKMIAIFKIYPKFDFTINC